MQLCNTFTHSNFIDYLSLINMCLRIRVTLPFPNGKRIIMIYEVYVLCIMYCAGKF